MAITGSVLCIRATEDVLLRELRIGGDLGTVHVFASRATASLDPSTSVWSPTPCLLRDFACALLADSSLH